MAKKLKSNNGGFRAMDEEEIEKYKEEIEREDEE